MPRPVSWMTGVFIDLRRAIAAGDLRSAGALLRNYPALSAWPDLSRAEIAALRGWGLLHDVARK